MLPAFNVASWPNSVIAVRAEFMAPDGRIDR
jgi:hypothetical protein